MPNSEDSLETRLRGVKVKFFDRRTEDSGHRPLEPDILKIRVMSCERHLSNKGISVKDYDRVYELACQIHVAKGAKGPFGIDEILMGADAFLEGKSRKSFYTKEIKKRVDCNNCSGTTLIFKENGEIKYNLEGKPERCTECYDSKN